MTSRSTCAAFAAFGIVASLFAYSFRLVRVQGRSMEPTFQPGQILLTRRPNWPSFSIRHGEIVVFRYDGATLIKRVAALPGDRPPLDDLRILSLVGASQRPELTRHTHVIAALLAPVPPGHLYVLGDNAECSEDSRAFGPIPMAAVIGRVIHWNVPDPPERSVIGYVAAGRSRALAHASAAARSLMGSAVVRHP